MPDTYAHYAVLDRPVSRDSLRRAGNMIWHALDTRRLASLGWFYALERAAGLLRDAGRDDMAAVIAHAMDEASEHGLYELMNELHRMGEGAL